jgi:multidrug efflux system membrane fusion protein
MRRASLFLVLVLAACGGPATDGKPGGSATAAPAGARKGNAVFPVSVQTVELSSVDLIVAATGAVEAFETMAVTARVAGMVEDAPVREGDAVTTDTVLATIDRDRYRLAYDAAAATLAQEQANLADSEQNLARRETLVRDQADQVRADEVATWKTRVAAARAAGARAEANLGVAELNRRDAQVRPPAAGIVQSRTVRTGAFVQPGTVIATLVRRDPLMLRFAVSAEDAQRLSKDMPVRFTVPGAEGERSGRLTFIAAAAGDVRMVDCLAQVDPPSRDGLLPGAFAALRVVVGQRSAAVVPETAIRSTDRGYVVALVTTNDSGETVARIRPISVGLRTADGRVEVRSGLDGGETLVVGGAEAIANGSRVAPRAGGPATAAGPSAGSATRAGRRRDRTEP